MRRRKFSYCLIETFVLSTILLYLFYFKSSSGEFFLSMNIHPLVIVVAAMALRYGGYPSLAAAMIASAFFIYAYTDQGKDLIVFLLEFRYYKYLLMFFITAVVLGRFKDNYDFETERSAKQIAILEESEIRLKEEYEKAHFIKDELKKQIVGAEYSILSLYEIASSLDTLSSEEVYTETMGLLHKFIKAKSVSIYQVDRSHAYMRLKIRMGTNGHMKKSISIEKDSCWNRMVEGKKAIRADAHCETGFPVMAAPLVREDSVMAIICIEDMDFENVSEYAFNLFKIIVEWVNKALVQSIDVGRQINRENCVAGTDLLTMEYFEQRCREERRRELRFDMEFGLLSYKVDENDIEGVAEKLDEVIREVDVPGYDKSSQILYVLLPSTPFEFIETVNDRIETAFDYLLEESDDSVGFLRGLREGDRDGR